MIHLTKNNFYSHGSLVPRLGGGDWNEVTIMVEKIYFYISPNTRTTYYNRTFMIKTLL